QAGAAVLVRRGAGRLLRRPGRPGALYAAAGPVRRRVHRRGRGGARPRPGGEDSRQRGRTPLDRTGHDAAGAPRRPDLANIRAWESRPGVAEAFEVAYGIPWDAELAGRKVPLAKRQAWLA